MKKRIFTIIFSAIISIVSMTACDVKKVDELQVSSTEDTVLNTMSTPAPTAEPWEINSFTEGVPVVTFGTKVMDGAGEFFLAMYDDVQIEDIEAYVQELVQSGFTQTGFEDGDFVKYTFENSNGKKISIDYAGAMTVSIYK